MTRFVAPMLVALFLTVAAPEADAQVMTSAPVGYGGTGVYAGYSRSYPVSYAPMATTSAPTPIPAYSYYLASPTVPARSYVSYGTRDVFPYYGRPYGHPYDPWTWSNLSSSPNDALNRYYYVPVR